MDAKRKLWQDIKFSTLRPSIHGVKNITYASNVSTNGKAKNRKLSENVDYLTYTKKEWAFWDD